MGDFANNVSGKKQQHTFQHKKWRKGKKYIFSVCLISFQAFIITVPFISTGDMKNTSEKKQPEKRMCKQNHSRGYRHSKNAIILSFFLLKKEIQQENIFNFDIAGHRWVEDCSNSPFSNKDQYSDSEYLAIRKKMNEIFSIVWIVYRILLGKKKKTLSICSNAFY